MNFIGFMITNKIWVNQPLRGAMYIYIYTYIYIYIGQVFRSVLSGGMRFLEILIGT